MAPKRNRYQKQVFKYGTPEPSPLLKPSEILLPPPQGNSGFGFGARTQGPFEGIRVPLQGSISVPLKRFYKGFIEGVGV